MLAKYEYKCRSCEGRVRSDERGDRLDYPHANCDNRTLVRVFGFSHKPSMEPHWNNAVGAPVSSMHQFKELLKIKSEEATAQTGIEHRFAPLEWGDHQAFGATGEGIEESNRLREKRGMPLLPEIG